MKQLCLLTFLVVALLALPAVAQKMAFIDVEAVILNYKKTNEITAALEKRVQAEMEFLRQGRRAIQERYAALELEQFDESDPASLLQRLKREKEIVLAEVDLENRDKSQRQLREREIVEHMKKVYVEVVKEVEIYCSSQGISAAFLVNGRPIEANTRNGVSSEILIKQIVWRDPALDITDQIVRRLNR
jgi:Skp family chaperone for outer membrane proteins